MFTNVGSNLGRIRRVFFFGQRVARVFSGFVRRLAGRVPGLLQAFQFLRGALFRRVLPPVLGSFLSSIIGRGVCRTGYNFSPIFNFIGLLRGQQRGFFSVTPSGIRFFYGTVFNVNSHSGVTFTGAVMSPVFFFRPNASFMTRFRGRVFNLVRRPTVNFGLWVF